VLEFNGFDSAGNEFEALFDAVAHSIHVHIDLGSIPNIHFAFDVNETILQIKNPSA
jgi:hypothetical protein